MGQSEHKVILRKNITRLFYDNFVRRKDLCFANFRMLIYFFMDFYSEKNTDNTKLGSLLLENITFIFVFLMLLSIICIKIESL